MRVGSASPSPPDTAPVRIDLWTWPLEAGRGRIAALARLLSADERQRASRLTFAQHRRQFIVGRAHMRKILASYLATPPAALAFCYGEQGKPTLSRYPSAPFFNLSHSGGFAALAVTHGCDVGIDIEEIRPIEPGVAKRFFSAAENVALQRLHAADRLDGFYRCWTRKEAVVKALGTGLALPLASFDVSLAPGAPACLLRLDGCVDARAQWSIVDLALGPSLIGAIAARTMGAAACVERRHLSGAIPSSAAGRVVATS